MIENSWMNVEQAAQYVGLSAYTVRRLAKDGDLPAAKIGRSYRFKRDDIDSYVRNQYRGTSDVNAIASS